MPLFTLNWYNTNYNNNCLFNTTICYSAHNRNSLLELHMQLVSRLLQLQLTHWSLYLALLQSNTFSLTNVLEMEGSCSRLLEKSTAAVCICAFSYMSFTHACRCCFRCSIYLLVCICVHITIRLCCICVIHLPHTYTDVIDVLLINSSMYICVSVAFVLLSVCKRY